MADTPMNQGWTENNAQVVKTTTATEKRGLCILLPWFRARCAPGEGKVRWLSGAELQKYGDFTVAKTKDDTPSPTFVEAKVEERNPHGNFFCEVWSNYSRRNPGWMSLEKCEADVLAYYFLESDELYMLNLEKLRDHVRANRHRYALREQSKHVQANDAYGYLVKIPEAMRAAGSHKVAIRPRAWRSQNHALFLQHQTDEEKALHLKLQSHDEWIADYESVHTDSPTAEQPSPSEPREFQPA